MKILLKKYRPWSISSFIQAGIVYVFVVGAACHLFPLSDAVKSFLAMPAFLIVPYCTGESLLFCVSFIPKLKLHSEIDKLDSISIFVVKWALGNIFIVTLAALLSLSHIFYFGLFFSILMACLLFSYYSSGRREKSLTVRDTGVVCLVALIGLSPVLWFKSLSVFPLQYYNPSFVLHSHAVLRIMDKNLLNFAIESYTPLFYLLLAIVSQIFNVHPYPLFWVLPFIGSPLFALGVFYLARKLMRDTKAAVLSSFLAGFLFTGGYFISNNAITQRGITIILFPFISYLIIDALDSNNDKNLNVFTLVKSISVALAIFLPRTYIGFKGLLAEKHFIRRVFS